MGDAHDACILPRLRPAVKEIPSDETSYNRRMAVVRKGGETMAWRRHSCLRRRDSSRRHFRPAGGSSRPLFSDKAAPKAYA
jgi:hypothetical protein